jgi:16S rRNA (guanine527-N7)-methyltransferase
MSDLLREGLLLLRQNGKDINGINGIDGADGNSAIDAIFNDRFEVIIRLLNAYINEIELFNAAYGLVGAKNRDEIIIKHILDSLAPLFLRSPPLTLRSPPLALLHSASHVADIGSGAGLPGIPLAIAMPDAAFTLVERMGRRAGFLRNVQAVLPLANIEIAERDMENVPAALFDLVCFRAFSPIENSVLKNLLRLLKPNGMIAAYKGRIEKIKSEMLAISDDAMRWEAIPYSVPFLNEERHLLLIQRLQSPD